MVIAAMLALSHLAAPSFASDAPLDSGPWWKDFLRLLLFGFPLSLLLLPALAVVPAFLIRAVASRSRERSFIEDAAYVDRSRRWRIWTLACLAPWLLLGIWIALAWIGQRM